MKMTAEAVGKKELKQKTQLVNQALIEFYGLPNWRNPLPPVDELVSTILSQSTNDRNRDMAFNNLKRKFVDWEAVRDAAPQDVVDAVRIAGLANQKAPRIQKVLQQISEERGDLDLNFLREMPPEEIHKWLVRFKGVGPKTAAIVMQFSLDIPAFPVDTHVYRVSGRLGLRPQKMNVEQAHLHLASLFNPQDYLAAHLNIIRFGREICSARGPKCTDCPLQKACDHYQTENN